MPHAAGGRHRRRIVVLVAGILPLVAAVPRSSTASDRTTLASADERWELRARGQVDGKPDPEPIRGAIAAYETLLEERPDDLEVRWKLLRAQHFYGEHVLEERTAKRRLYARTRELADASRRLLLERHGLGGEEEPAIVAERLAGGTEAAAIYYYSAVHWGLWGETTGRLEAARAGVASRLRDFGATVVGIDETFDEAAGHRLLGRLHTEAPRIPLVTGWIDRDRAISELEAACAIAPQNPYNQLFLADALIRFRTGRRDEAIGRLERVVGSVPRNEQLIEDLAAIEEARHLLGRYQRGELSGGSLRTPMNNPGYQYRGQQDQIARQSRQRRDRRQ